MFKSKLYMHANNNKIRPDELHYITHRKQKENIT
jgi:hypothetical protein